jgi:hypothetical protein
MELLHCPLLSLADHLMGTSPAHPLASASRAQGHCFLNTEHFYAGFLVMVMVLGSFSKRICSVKKGSSAFKDMGDITVLLLALCAGFSKSPLGHTWQLEPSNPARSPAHLSS